MSKVLLGFIVLVAIFGFWGVSGYNKLVSLDQAVQAQWSQVENVYQRRADLVPNLVETVKGAAAFEKDTFTAVAQARAQVGQISAQGMDKVLNDPQAFQRFPRRQGPQPVFGLVQGRRLAQRLGAVGALAEQVAVEAIHEQGGEIRITRDPAS